MRLFKTNTGTTLVELMIVISIFSIVMAMVFTQFSTLLQITNLTRKGVKTEADVVTVIWPLLKDIESAGYGLPASGSVSTGACNPESGITPLTYSNGVLTIHSTASGDNKNSGAWSIIGTDCSVTGIDNGELVVILNPSNKQRINFTNISSGKLSTTCSSSLVGMIAYWVPQSGSLECYETAFSKRTYTATNKPNMCAEGTDSLSRSVVYNTGSINYQPMLDCVLDIDFRFGCLNSTTGNLTWRNDHSCTASDGALRYIKVGVILQESTKFATASGETSLSMFTDTGNTKTITLTTAQRYYKWKILEKTIALRNLE